MKLILSKKMSKMTAVGILTAIGVFSYGMVATPAYAAQTQVKAGYTVQQKSPITVLPIDNAKFLAGQKFDFLIEVADATTADMTVNINGKSADKYFGKDAKVSLDGTTARYRIDNVSLNEAGTYDIKVKAGNVSREISYNVVKANPQKAKNVILMVGDGMSLQARELARIIGKGMQEGKFNDVLEMEKMPNLALITTSGYDSLVTDSANSASAYATGNKAAVNAFGVYADSTKDPFDDPKVENIIEITKRTRGMATGLVTTADVTDATPAAMLSHTRRRSEMNFIADSMLNPEQRPDVIMGGGAQHFYPQGEKVSSRKDDKNLVKDFVDLGYAVSTNKQELEKTSNNADKILGLYHKSTMNVYVDREMIKNPKVLGDYQNQPGLVEMTDKAINALAKNKNGFFLMVEGASIDKQLHEMDWQRATYDTLEFDKTVKLCRDYAEKNKDTLVIVLADHAHGASISGTYYESDGKTGREAVRIGADSKFPTFEDRDGDGYPDNPNPDVTIAVQYANHPEAMMDYKFKAEPTPVNVKVDGKVIANPAIHGEYEPGNIPAVNTSEEHAADDIILNAEGPGAEYFHGVMDNTEVFFGMVNALGLDGTKNVNK